ncbi:MAG: four-carbon acid sugar kinase family protein [Eubacteriales bacterium]|nr:four-carbon acid sugar kinase family protein [Eubacteriales bacterium]
MPHTIVIADDVTGANDIGIMYAKAGLSAYVYSYREGERPAYPSCDALIIDTDSRFDTAQRAYEKVQRALEGAPVKEARQFIDKQCSVFRGNIGAEFDAMLDTLGAEFAVVVLGFPDNGRTTLHGIHYVNGVRLEDSQFRHDPVHPMTRSDLAGILQAQTKRKVGSVFYEVYDQGRDALRRALREAEKSCNYCIMDVRDNRDLELLAEVLENQQILCGSSALSEYLAKREADQSGIRQPEGRFPVPRKVFCIAGSLTPQTIGQTAYMAEQGYPVITLDTRRLLEKEERQAELERVYQLVCKGYQSKDFVMVHSMNRAEEVAATKALALSKGMDNTQVSGLVSSALSEVAVRVVEAYGIRRIIVCGGDTSATLCSALHVNGMRVLEEIEAGLPTCESVDEPHYRMVLKSGSFGSRSFVEKAREKLLLERKEETCQSKNSSIC